MGSTINLKAADGFTLSAYTAGPAGATKGIVVIQEIFGVNHHMRDMCDRFAAEGYAVVRAGALRPRRAGRGAGLHAGGHRQGPRLSHEAGRRQGDGRRRGRRGHLAGKKLGIVGYCFGGTVAWWGATRTNKFAASSCWYGGGIAGTKDERPNCPVQMHFGEKDASIPMTDVEAIRAAQPKAESYVYMGAQHGFGCDERGSYSKPDYELAQKRTLEFFAKLLG